MAGYRDEPTYVDVDFDCIKLDKAEHDAILVTLELGDNGHADKVLWIPRSQIGEVDKENGTMEVQEWFAEREGLV